MTTPRVTVPVENLRAELHDHLIAARRRKSLTLPKDLGRRLLSALSAAPAPEGGEEVPSSWSIRYQGLATREEAPAEAGEDNAEGAKLPAGAISGTDDGQTVWLESNTGGAHSLGLWGGLSLRFEEADGSFVVRDYEDVNLRAHPQAREDDSGRPIEATWTDGATHAYVNLSAALSAERQAWRQKLGLRIASVRYLDVEVPPAREDAQPVGWKHTDKCWGKTSYSDEMAHCYCQKEQEKEASPQPVGWLRPDTLKGLMDADESVVGIQSLVAAHETKHNTVAVYTHPAPDAQPVADREGLAKTLCEMDTAHGGAVWSRRTAEEKAHYRTAADAIINRHTHPAPDALRVAVEALGRIATVDMGGGFLGAQACRQVATEALAALLAENAALRGSEDKLAEVSEKCSQWIAAHDEAIERAAEAERKLAEADQVIRDIAETPYTGADWPRERARTFLSKEAERG